jgi:C4-dicarboxylate-specific signal transduction histidine kinase
MQTVPVLCALGFAFTLFAGFLVYTEISADKRQIQTLLKILAQNLQGPVMFQDQDEVKRLLVSLKEQTSIDQVALFDEKQQSWIVGLGQTTGLEQTRINKCTLGICLYAVPVEREGQKFATLYVTSSLNRTYYQLLQLGVIMLLVLVASLLMATLVARQFAADLTQPVARFLEVVKKIALEENFRLRVQPLEWKKSAVKEIDELADGFDEMILTIENRDRMLDDLNQALEEKVKERTEELARERMKGLESSRLASLGEMAAGIAHEINNPLSVIRASAERIAERAASDDKLAKPANRIVAVADRIAKIINGMRTFSRDGRSDPFVEVSVSEIVNDTLEFCQARFLNHGVELRVQSLNSEIKICGRSAQISQILLNLLNNAFDAIKSTSNEGWVGIELVPAARGQGPEIYIFDSGPGVPQELEAKVLQPFFTTKGVGKGTGLGLSISRSIMAEHGGTLILDAKVRPTTFVLRFPEPKEFGLSLKAS